MLLGVGTRGVQILAERRGPGKSRMFPGYWGVTGDLLFRAAACRRFLLVLCFRRRSSHSQ